MAQDLHKACLEGNLGLVRRLLADVPSLDLNMVTEGSQHYFLLHAACTQDNVKLVDMLCKRGASVNLKDAQGDAPLHIAASMGNPNVVGKLIDYGADVDIQNDQTGDTPLHMATVSAVPTPWLPGHVNEKSYRALCRLLVGGASLRTNNSNYTPLDHVARAWNARVISKLLEGKTFFYVEGNVSTLKRVLLFEDDNTATTLATLFLENSYPRTLGVCLLAEVLVYTHRAGQSLDVVMRRIQLLLQTPESPELFPGGLTALLNAAIILENVDVVRLLIDSGAAVNVMDYESSPLRLACAVNNPEIVDLLLNRGARVNEIFSGPSLLYCAVMCRDSDLVPKLLQYGADVNLQYKGRTPLHMAYIYGRVDLAKSLIHFGAKSDIKDNYGKIPLEYLIL